MTSQGKMSQGKLTVERREALSQAAVDARRAAYAPYSNYPVGAALLTDSGEIFKGCNVENGSLGLTICAERVAAAAAVTAGQRQFLALAVAAAGGATPCGGCRQFLAEFSPELPVLLVDVQQKNAVREVRLSDLLPQPYGLQRG
ncbi:MAG: cytidine deaminase [Planctomycetales bacterium]|nr:cytidine deaminase [Planctomycetales bacterium]NIM08048.1 cytidine deaminase [Planctomycetales bacterium]NIN07539.1 cytidine deaminase [Planctomycetales bacterium]NIN76646.1 cytidine deaminase [Planctomycetales bacterium]NIO33834.1 cytidine deaminase [Planctomycetales bacterium]